MNTVRFRVGLADVCAALIVVVVVLLPAPDPSVIGAYTRLHSQDDRVGTDAQLAQLGRYQATLAEHPGDGETADEFSRLLMTLLEYDHALRVAGEAATHPSSSRWRAYLAVSYTHADRLEIGPAHQFAGKALAECEAAKDACDDEARIRLSMYEQTLRQGVADEAKGADPREQPEEFKKSLSDTHPTSTWRPGSR